MNKMIISLFVCMLLIGCSGNAQVAAPTVIPTAIPTMPPPPTDTPAPKIAHIVAFGDSLIDDGNFLKIATELAKNNMMDPEWWPWAKKIYWENPVNNQPTAVKVLADRLGVEINNYAVGGAQSGMGNANDSAYLFMNTGVLGQIKKYRDSLAGQPADPQILYIVQATGNDFLVLNTPSEEAINHTVDKVVANVVQAVKNLLISGAKQILILNTPDLSITPWMINDGYVEEATAFQTRVNGALPAEMEKLSIEYNVPITIFDYAALNQKIFNNSGQYGLTNLTGTCVEYPKTEICQSPDTYYFFDDIHPTRRVQQIIGEAMADQLK